MIFQMTTDKHHLHWIGPGLVLTLIAILCFSPIQSTDLFIYLAIGETISNPFNLPVMDPFLYTLPDLPWQISHEWLGFLLFLWSFKLASWTGAILLKTFVLLTSFCLPFVVSKKLRVNNPALLVFGVMAVFSSLARFQERTSIFTDLFVVLVFSFLLLHRQKKSKYFFVLPVVFALWSNIHPGFALGLAILGLFSLTFDFKNSALCLFLSALGCLINPEGLSGLLFPFKFMATTAGQYKKVYFEFLSPLDPIYIHNPVIWVYLAFLAGVAIFLFRARSKDIFFSGGVFLITGAMGLWAVRFIPLSCLCGLLALVDFLRARPLKFSNVDSASRAVVTLLVIGNLTVLFVGFTNGLIGSGLNEYFFPTKNMEVLKTLPSRGPLFNSDLIGGYILWAGAGDPKVFYHGAVNNWEFYSQDYLPVFTSEEHFDRVVTKYGIKTLLISKLTGITPLHQFLAQRKDWVLLSTDAASDLYVKTH